MAGSTNYPGSADTYAKASPTNLGDDDTTGRTHHERHDDIEAAMEAVQANAIAKTLIDAKGDLLVGSADNAAARLAVGTDTWVLTADSTATNGVKWAPSLESTGYPFGYAGGYCGRSTGSGVTSLAVTPYPLTSSALVLLFINVSSSVTVTAPPGWTSLGTAQTGTGTNSNKLHGFYRTMSTAGGIRPALMNTFTFSTVTRMGYSLVVFNGAQVGNVASSGTGSAGTSLATATVTASAGSSILSVWGSSGNAAGDGVLGSAPSPLTDADGTAWEGDDTYRYTQAGYESGVAAGTTTARTATTTGSSAIASWTVEVKSV